MDENQENMRATTSEENHEEDVRKLLEMVGREEIELEMMQQEDMEHEEQRGRVALNMGAGGSHSQATSDPRKKKETRVPRWADCNDEEGKENEEEVEEEKEAGQQEMTDKRPPGLEEVESKQEEKKEQEAERKQKQEQEQERRAQEAREEERRAQEVHEEQRRAEKALEKRKAQEEQEREAEVQGEHESDVKAQEGHEGEVKAQEEQGEDANSLHEESHVLNRHMTWWRNAWWVRVNNGPHLQTARDRRRVWLAATRAAREMRATQETQCESGERKRETGKMERKRKQHVAHRAAPTHQHNSINPTTAATAAAARSSCIQRLAVCDAVNASLLPFLHC